jgi:hypothetical protein
MTQVPKDPFSIRLNNKSSICSCEIWDFYAGEYENVFIWDVVPLIMVERYRRFGGACCLDLQGRRVRPAWKRGCRKWNGAVSGPMGDGVTAFSPILFITFRIRIFVPLFSCAAYYFTLKKKQVGSSEALVYSYWTIWRYILWGCLLHFIA